MYLGRVVGCVWSTVKAAGLTGQRFLVIQPITPQREDRGKRIICLDSTGAGAGETVYWVRGKEASFPFRPDEVPADTTVVGIVDSIHLGGAPAPQTEPPPRTNRAGTPRKGRKC